MKTIELINTGDEYKIAFIDPEFKKAMDYIYTRWVVFANNEQTPEGICFHFKRVGDRVAYLEYFCDQAGNPIEITTLDNNFEEVTILALFNRDSNVEEIPELEFIKMKAENLLEEIRQGYFELYK